MFKFKIPSTSIATTTIQNSKNTPHKTQNSNSLTDCDSEKTNQKSETQIPPAFLGNHNSES